MNIIPNILSILLIQLSGFIYVKCSEEILGCGGFVKSHADIDFSKVEVKLFTKQGSLKDKTDCSPSNGYYFLPVYDKGEYTLQISPPPGWSFEPEQIDIVFDGKTDLCSLGKDVNFSFKGFGITGKVNIFDQKGGARGVNVELQSDTQGVRSTVSDAYGVFYFTPVIPGPYTIQVRRDRWHFAQSAHKVIVETGNTELPDDYFIVDGFDVFGRLLNGGQSQSNIGVALYVQKTQTILPNCKPTDLPNVPLTHAEYKRNVSCYTLVDANGVYRFPAIPPGRYLLKTHVLNKDIQLHIQPDTIEFIVSRDFVAISDNFEVTGFSVSGRVLASANGWGIPNAQIKLNGQLVTQTHSDGTYVLQNIKAETYTIQVVADNVQINDQAIRISLDQPKLPDIIVSSFKVCGQVISHQAYTIAITRHSSTFHTQAMSKAGTGVWCTYLSSGRYSAEVLTSSEDRTLGVQFFPLQQNIEVNASPVSGIIFSQLRATVTGYVQCLPDAGANCNDITITLYSLDSSGNQNGQYITAVLSGGKYTFAEVLPGTYEVSVPSPSLCWETTTLVINVQSATETIPTFVHTGYLVSVISSHTTQIRYKLATEQSVIQEMTLIPGLNSFCVSKFGQYDISFVGCHYYDDNLPTTLDTGSRTPITITATKHRNGIRILSDEKTQFSLLVEAQGQKETVTPTLEAERIDGFLSYRYEFRLKADELITVTPHSDIMLLKPESQDIMGGTDCVDTAFSFIASKGVIINGKIQPPISNAKIILTFSNSTSRPLETVSGDAGTFRFGPFDGSLTFTVKAYKESYVFAEFDSKTQTFVAHKLCEIIVSVRDEQANQLAGVLLSLSGAASYRKNLLTKDDGTIKFHSLSPSQYYLRPMMKEYRFEPTSKMIDIKDGETVTVELIGKRVAYSLYGTVTSLNGEPFAGVVIETRAREPCAQHQEEASVEPNGSYRIRGLQPGCQYSVRVQRTSNVDRTIPDEQVISIDNSDLKSVNIIAISPLAFVDVIARVYAANNDFYKTLRISLYKKGSADSPVYSQRIESPLNVKGRINPGIMVFFPRIPYDDKTYFVELSTTLSDKSFAYTMPVESFVTNRSSIFVELNFEPKVRSIESELNQNSLSALLLIILIAVAFFKQDLAFDFVNFLWSRISKTAEQALARSGGVMGGAKKKDGARFEATFDESEIEKLAQSINATKKKSVRRVN